MKIIDYGVILYESTDHSQAYNEFRRMVKERIAEGWEPQGGIYTSIEVTRERSVYMYAQAMILREGRGEPIE